MLSRLGSLHRRPPDAVIQPRTRRECTHCTIRTFRDGAGSHGQCNHRPTAVVKQTRGGLRPDSGPVANAAHGNSRAAGHLSLGVGVWELQVDTRRSAPSPDSGALAQPRGHAHAYLRHPSGNRAKACFVAVCPGMWQQPFALSDTSRFLWWLEMGNVYLKLLSREHLNCQRALCLAQPLLASALCGAADRLLWGSGCPYPSARPLPASASLQSDGRLSWSANALDFNARAVYGFND